MRIAIYRVISEWRDPDSNRGHHDFQTSAIDRTLARKALQRARSRTESLGWRSLLRLFPEGCCATDGPWPNHARFGTSSCAGCSSQPRRSGARGPGTLVCARFPATATAVGRRGVGTARAADVAQSRARPAAPNPCRKRIPQREGEDARAAGNRRSAVPLVVHCGNDEERPEGDGRCPCAKTVARAPSVERRPKGRGEPGWGPRLSGRRVVSLRVPDRRYAARARR